jgi:hypothetical protein
MIFNRSILAGAVEIARHSGKAILLEPSGEVVAQGDHMLFVAQPLSSAPGILKGMPPGKALKHATMIPGNQLGDVLKAMPRKATGPLEPILITDAGSDVFQAHGPGINEIYHGSPVGPRMVGIRAPESVLGWRGALKDAVAQPVGIKALLFNRKWLGIVVGAIEKACRYDGSFAFIQQMAFSHGYIWKCLNELSGQMVIIAWELPGSEKAVGFGSPWFNQIFFHRKMVSKH